MNATKKEMCRVGCPKGGHGIRNMSSDNSDADIDSSEEAQK